MARGTALKSNFTAGELSPLLDVRSDIKQYANGANQLRNAIVLPHGGAKKRPGSRFIGEVKTSSAAAPRLVPFEFNTAQAYMLEFGNNYIRIYKDQGTVATPGAAITAATKANPCVLTVIAHGIPNGTQVLISGVGGMTQLNGRRAVVANATTDTFELQGINSTGYTAFTSGGLVQIYVEVTTTYATAVIDALSFAQSADTLFIAHPSHPLRKLTRSSHTSWTLSDADIVNGPFRPINADTTHYMTVSASASVSISAVTKANPAVVTTTAPHDFGEGACVAVAAVSGMTQLNGNKYICRNVGASTFELWTIYETPVDSSAYSTYTSGGTATIATTTNFGTLSPGSKIGLASTDALFTASHVGALFRLWEPGQKAGVMTPAATVSMPDGTVYTYAGNVYGAANVTGGNSTWLAAWTFPTHTRGVVRIDDAAGTAYHDSVYLHDSSCVLEILSVTNSTNAVARVVRNHVPKSIVTGRTSVWEEGAWSTERGFPAVITFHRSRLWAASTVSDPQYIWASRIKSFEDFQDGADADNAIVDQMASDRVEITRWLSPGNTLLLGTASAEHAVLASSQNEAVTPANMQIVPQTPYGSSAFHPLRLADATLFGQRNGEPTNAAQRIREISYSLNDNKFVAPDLTIISEHITGTGVTEAAFTGGRVPIAWFVREDGLIAGLTYEPEQAVKGWHLHTIGGAYSTGDAVVERAAKIPGADGDELWLVVKRTVNSATVRHIEVLTNGLTDDLDKEDAVYLDSALTYDGASASTITQLWHLEGQAVRALVDGSKQGPFTVATGRITLTSPGTLVHVGLQYETVIETLDLDALAQAGTAKSRAKRISQVWPSVYRSLGGTIGPDSATQQAILYRTNADVFGTSPALKTGTIEFDFPAGWDREARVRFEHDEPYPFCVRGVAIEANVSG